MSWLALNDHWLSLAPVLLHTLWQGGPIALVLAGALMVLPASRPRLRYCLSIAALLAVLLAAFLTHAIYDHQSERSATVGAVEVSASVKPTLALVAEPVSATEPASVATPSAPSSADYRRIVVAAWMLGVVLMIARLAFALRAAETMRRESRPCPDRGQLEVFEQLARRIGCAEGRLRLLIADHLEGPVAMGVLWPAVILPGSLATGASPETLRAILAHEIAHIRRQDYLVNLGQLFVETLLFFNPAVWLISRWIRIEREACCDALAARMLDDEADYAEALANYAAQRRSLPLPALAFSNERQPSSLAERVRRLLVPGYRPRVRLPLTSLALLLLGGGLILAALHEGSRAAVKVGAKLLSPEERIEKIQEIQRTHALKGRGNYEGITSDSPKVSLRGRVVDEAGNPVTNKHVHARARRERPHSSGSHALNVRDGIVYDEIGAGEIHAAVLLKGYAPAIVGPLDGQPGSSFTNLTLSSAKGSPPASGSWMPRAREFPASQSRALTRWAFMCPCPRP